MSNLKTPWLTMIELPVGANASQRANFEDQPQLTTLMDQDIKILGIEVYPPSAFPTAPSGNSNATLAQLQNAMLVLVNDDKQRVYQTPLLALNRIFGDTSGNEDFIPHIMDLQLFDRLMNIHWTKSGVEFAEPPAGAPYSYLFGIHYEKLSSETAQKV